jgi:hypothetical protein
MTSRSLASSHYGKRYTRDRERTGSRVIMIRGTTNFEMHRRISLRGYRNEEIFVNNTIKQST